MARSPSHRWALIGGFAVAAVYAVVALVEILVNSNPAAAIPFAYVAVCVAGPLAVVARFVGPSHRDEPGGGSSDGGNGPGPPDGDDDPGPAWWAEFEQDFWSHVDDAPQPALHDRVTPSP
jgi:hypothetical protein